MKKLRHLIKREYTEALYNRKKTRLFLYPINSVTCFKRHRAPFLSAEIKEQIMGFARRFLRIVVVGIAISFVAIVHVNMALASDNLDSGQILVEEALAEMNVVVQETFSGNVVAVASGDIITVDKKGTPLSLRLYGIDTPEEGQPFFEKSREHLLNRILNTKVTVRVLATDSLKMAVALVSDSEGVSLSHWLVREGLAWRDDINAAKDNLLNKLNAGAIREGRGLFADAAPLAPWDYRRSKNLPEFTYTLTTPEPVKAEQKSPPIQEEKEPKELSARGTMTESRPRPATTPSVDSAPMLSSIPGLPKELTKDVNLGEIMMKHQPRIAYDDVGRPLGLTASNVDSIPYATQYGFREGDIVSKVNGIPIESEAQIFSLIPQFMNEKTFQLEVLRNGQVVPITITVK